jgi:deoxyribodipyrimidine photo-lyase
MFDELTRDPRVRVRTNGPADPEGRCVVYWMQRAHRAVDNPALDTAIAAGNELGQPVVVFLGLVPFVERANLRHYHFLVEGIADVADELRRRRVGFVLRRYPDHRLEPFLAEVRASLVVGDESPLRQFEGWRRTIAARVRLPFWTVDADVVVPSVLLKKEQYAARTMRPRVHEHLDRFLTVAPRSTRARVEWRRPRGLMTLGAEDALLARWPIDRSVGPVRLFRGGTVEARRRLTAFTRGALMHYDEARNEPSADGTSLLSPYLHFGHIGPREVALAVRSAGAPSASSAAFLEQLIVRRELAVNFVTYNPDYDSLRGCEPWARATLAAHRRDRRPYLYTESQLESADTHDPLWNAAQRQMIEAGWMHGYVRMYWAKKILEWTRHPDEAFQIAVRMNDRYFLDGRDPNGYTNIAWAIGGKHDRPWPRREVFGTIRAMSFESTRRKFDSAAYIARWSGSVSRARMPAASRRRR